MRWIYISPHFDDAVLSCGGLIWEQGHQGIPVEIWTVTAGNPPPGPISEFIVRTHAMWNTGTPQETVILRRAEDRNAAAQVGAGTRHQDTADGIYRQDRKGNLIYTESVFVPIDIRDGNIIAQVSEQIAEGLDADDTLVCPLALGGHVDHIITRLAVESLRSTGLPLWFYADIPYFFSHQFELSLAVKGFQEKNYFVSDHGLAAWQAGIESYQSQVSSLFADKDDMRQKINDYCLARDGLTLWRAD